ncbi:FAA hydrolase family protein [Acetobacter sp. LMG 1636]|uniref:FAA hydrolase family protein n=2 Tax=Acetobacter fallax TaxID=1737473 RepID=A0ABX0K8L6_9PROT|nr:FAA hydrolase family protein [Acetobacter fallax]NHO35794.1 FAA hydrolase family protein [Acetobacter fallax]
MGSGRLQAAQAASPASVIPPLPVPALPVAGQNAIFPVRRVYCVGRNYLAHIKELNHDTREPPFFFQKARDMLVQNNAAIPYPTLTHDYEHEIELVLAMKSGGMNIPVSDAENHIYGYAVGLDMTRRDLQKQAQEKRQPWEAGKSFDNAAPCGSIVPVTKSGHLNKGRIHLELNGQTAADGNLEDMIWSPAEIIAHLSTAFEIAAGDLIYTGTPRAVGKVSPGDKLAAHIDGLPSLRISILS